MKRILLLLIAILSIQMNAQTIVPMGTESASGHIKVIFTGDGFTVPNQNAFLNKAQDIKDAILDQEPFKSYASTFNFYTYMVPSNSGSISVQGGNTYDTYWSSYSNNGGMTRSFGCDRQLIEDELGGYSQGHKVYVILIANTTMYGGSGEFDDYKIDGLTNINTQMAIVTMYNSANDNGSTFVPLHEWGHTFGNLADEYFGDGANGSDETYNILMSTPDGQATVAASGNKANVSSSNPGGWHEGANYQTNGWWRATPNDIMRGAWEWSAANNRWEAKSEYDAPNLALLTSRIYTHPTSVDLTKLYRANVGTYQSSGQSCSQYLGSSFYYRKLQVGHYVPQVGSKVYSDKYGTVPFNGGNKYYLINDSNSTTIKINTQGVVMHISTCSNTGGGYY